MPAIKITAENVSKFPIGTQCEFMWGCPPDTGGGDWDDDVEQVTEALVVGWGLKPAGTWNDPYHYLEVETNKGEVREVREFVTTGIGCYLTQNVEGI